MYYQEHEAKTAVTENWCFLIPRIPLKISFPSLVKTVESSVPRATSSSASHGPSWASPASRWSVSIKSVRGSRKRQVESKVVNWMKGLRRLFSEK